MATKLRKQLTHEQAKKLLLSNCPPNQGVISSHDLLTRCESKHIWGSKDILRNAYWHLVDLGQLIRVPNGVYKRQTVSEQVMSLGPFKDITY